nr:S-layer homology domain-containing protein [Paenibacillus soyae]
MAISVDERETFQTIEGFGASMTDSSAWLIDNKLTAPQRNELMSRLFSREDGIGISYIRVPMGSSDFALGNYTYNDMPQGETDPSLNSFSIAHDKDYIIPLLQQAKLLNPDLKLMGTPWSAPAWMKTNGSLMQGKLKPEYYGVYAEYFRKFIEAYEAEGLPIHAITLQNEPHFEPSGYPGMRMEPSEQIALAKELGPLLAEEELNTKIVVWDHNWDEPQYPIQVLNDEEARTYIAGSAFHGYAGSVDAQQQVHDAHPDKEIYFTESSGGEFAPNFGDNLKWDVQNLIIGATRYWAKTSLKWNLALDQNHGPQNGGCHDCRGFVTINVDDIAPENTEVTFNEEYYAFGHASKFVVPGAVRIDSNTLGAGSIENVAFKNPDGSKVVVALNSGADAETFKLRWGSQSFSYTLPAGAVATFKWSGEQTGDSVISPFSRIEAETADAHSGVIENTDDGSGKHVKLDGADQHATFRSVGMNAGVRSALLRVATEGNATIELREGSSAGTLLGEVEVNTGGYAQWKTQMIEVNVDNSVLDIVVLVNGKAKLNWLTFSKEDLKSQLNYAASFGGFESGNAGGWLESKPEGQASAQQVDGDGAHTGDYKLTHFAGSAYEQYTYRTIHVPNGTYSASVWVRKGEGNTVTLEARNGSDAPLIAATGAVSSGWTQLVIPSIKITSGQLEIGVRSVSPAGQWAAIDDFVVSGVTKLAPAAELGTDAPDTPASVAAVVREDLPGAVEISWSGVEGASGYALYRSLSGDDSVTNAVYGSFAEFMLVPAGTTSFVDTGLQAGQAYAYRVTAFHATGESAASEEAAAMPSTTDTDAPAKPAGLTAVEGPEQATLHWSPSLDADFKAYNVYQNGARIASIGLATETTFTAGSLYAGMTYTFEVSAVDRSGNESARSDMATVVPTAPSVTIEAPNLGFEDGLSGWNEWHPDGQESAQLADETQARSGEASLKHGATGAYKQTTYREIVVPNGEYRVTVWAKAGGADAFRMELKKFDGTSSLTADMSGADGSEWTPYRIDHVLVKDGKLELGFYSEAGENGGWAHVDDIEIMSYAPKAPGTLRAEIGTDKAYLWWNRSGEKDFKTYKVYKDGQLIATQGENFLQVTGLATGTAYQFQVSAVDTANNESPASVLTVVPKPSLSLTNLGFEAGALSPWQGWHPSDQADANKVDTDGPRTGAHKLTHWLGTDYEQSTYRTITVPNSTYQVSAWVRTGGGQNALRMEVKNYGGEQINVDMRSASSGTWTLFASPPIAVTNGQLEISFYSNAKAGNWTAIDDVQVTDLIGVPAEAAPPAAPVGLKGEIHPDHVRLVWERNGESDIAGYRVYQDGELIAEPTEPAYVAENVDADQTYRYTVTAVNAEELESEASAEFTATTREPAFVEGFESGQTEPWGVWNTGGTIAVNEGGAHGGAYKLNYWHGEPYEATTYRTIEVPNGTYRVSIWTQAGDNKEKLQLEVKKYDAENENASTIVNMMAAHYSGYRLFVSEPIPVTSGKLEIGINAKMTASEWANFDDLRIVKVDPIPDEPTDPVIVPPVPPVSSGGNDKIKIDENGAAVVKAEAGAEEVRIPAAKLDMSKLETLRVEQGSLGVDIPAAVVKALLQIAEDEGLSGAEIRLTARPVTKKETDGLLADYQHPNGSSLRPAGDVYDCELAIVDRDGEGFALTAFDSPITIRLQADPSANEELLGIYYLAEDGSLEYVGGSYADGYMQAYVSHFSRYAVLEYDRSFADVTAEHWAYGAIKRMAAKHIAQGVGEDRFAPEREVTRAELAALLSRSLGLTAEAKAPFQDVDGEAWYAADVSAAYEAGIIQGKTDELFLPDQAISREEMAIMLMRSYEYLTGEVAAADGASSRFADLEDISAWALEQALAAEQLGLVQGDERQRFAPQEELTRAEAIQAIANLLDSKLNSSPSRS